MHYGLIATDFIGGFLCFECGILKIEVNLIYNIIWVSGIEQSNLDVCVHENTHTHTHLPIIVFSVC